MIGRFCRKEASEEWQVTSEFSWQCSLQNFSILQKQNDLEWLKQLLYSTKISEVFLFFETLISKIRFSPEMLGKMSNTSEYSIIVRENMGPTKPPVLERN